MGERVPNPGPWLWTTRPAGGLATECWIEVRPEAAASVDQWLAAWLTDTDMPIIVSPLLPAERFATDPLVQFNDRPSRWLWPIAGALAGLALAGVTWFRRAELALYVSVGVGRGTAALVYALPAALFALWGTAAGLATATLGFALSRAPVGVSPGQDLVAGVHFVIEHGAEFALAAIAVATLGHLVSVASRGAAAIRGAA